MDKDTKYLLEKFTEDIGFILAFLVGALVVQSTLGNKVLYAYLLLVLASMAVLNASKIKYYLGRVKNG